MGWLTFVYDCIEINYVFNYLWKFDCNLSDLTTVRKKLRTFSINRPLEYNSSWLKKGINLELIIQSLSTGKFNRTIQQRSLTFLHIILKATKHALITYDMNSALQSQAKKDDKSNSINWIISVNDDLINPS